MSELDELRQKRIRQLVQQQSQQNIQEQLQEQMRAEEVNSQIKHIVSKLMDSEARDRLNNIRLVKPEFARQVEVLLIQMYQTGRIRERMNDETFRAILDKIRSGKREGTITRK
ncbi:MAG: DNA-binding protein [Candidatus Altiarchaeota archaeon]